MYGPTAILVVFLEVKKSLLPGRGCYYRLNQNSRLKRSAYSQRVTVCEQCPTY